VSDFLHCWKLFMNFTNFQQKNPGLLDLDHFILIISSLWIPPQDNTVVFDKVPDWWSRTLRLWVPPLAKLWLPTYWLGLISCILLLYVEESVLLCKVPIRNTSNFIFFIVHIIIIWRQLNMCSPLPASLNLVATLDIVQTVWHATTVSSGLQSAC
jgi:hypothetical protein